MVKNLEIPNIINKLLREDKIQEDSKNDYDNNIIVINMPNRFINSKST